MARPQKEGMDYFPHDTDASTDEKVEALRLLYGNNGYAFYFILLERIYRTSNFELDISDAETRQILARKIAVTEEDFNKMLDTAFKRNCFDHEEYLKRKVLTSNGIKKRAGIVIEKREKMREKYHSSKPKVSDAETREETTPEMPQSKEKKSKEKKSKSIIYSVNSEEYRLASLLKQQILLNNPTAKLPDPQRWCTHIDYMLRIDKRPSDEVEQIIIWCQNDDFWKANILSTEKLRKKYDQLKIRMQNERKVPISATNKPSSEPDDWEKQWYKQPL